MSRNISIKLSFMLLLLLCWGLLGCKSLSQLQPDPRIVWIELDKRRTAEDVFDLNLNMDIWEVSKKHLVIKTTDNIIRSLRNQGYAVIILYANEESYYETINNGVVPLRIAKINCQTIQECQTIGTSDIISGVIARQEHYLIVKVTETQLINLYELNYDAHLLYATEHEYLRKETQP